MAPPTLTRQVQFHVGVRPNMELGEDGSGRRGVAGRDSAHVDSEFGRGVGECEGEALVTRVRVMVMVVHARALHGQAATTILVRAGEVVEVTGFDYFFPEPFVAIGVEEWGENGMKAGEK